MRADKLTTTIRQEGPRSAVLIAILLVTIVVTGFHLTAMELKSVYAATGVLTATTNAMSGSIREDANCQQKNVVFRPHQGASATWSRVQGRSHCSCTVCF